MTRKQKMVLIRIVISAVLLGALLLLPFVPETGWVRLVLFLIPYFVIGYDILRKAIKGIIHLQPFDENFLMAVATVGALAVGEYTESVAVMLFYQIGELFQSYAVGKSRRSISALMDIRPEYANLVSGEDDVKEVDPEEVPVGSLLLIKPGERVPIDGTVEKGTSALDTSALTGESVPRTVHPGDSLISGCINQSGVLYIRTTRAYGESTVSRILDLVENASSKKSRSENFIAKFAKIYTPAVCFAALALAVLPPLFRLLILQSAPMWSDWVYRALTFLVISCPCALVISIPLSFFAGIGGAGQAGILIKGSNYMETLSKVRCVAFDKTGTMTEGVFEVADVHHNTMEKDRLLEYAALAESYSTHPISQSIRRAWKGEVDLSRVSEVREIGGHGVSAKIDGVPVLVGNEKLMKQNGIPFVPCHGTGSVVHIAIDGAYAGHLLIQDRIKPDAAEAIRRLHAIGVNKTVMLTGDNASVGTAVAEKLGIDEVHSELLPEGKVEQVERLLSEEQKSGGKLAFVGDGINDAPVLSRVDVGIAMGALGSDAAIEAADVVLMDDHPTKIATAIRISRKCLRIVYENIIFALGVKAVCLVLGAMGIASMGVAVFADVGVMVLAVLNAIRALRVKNL